MTYRLKRQLKRLGNKQFTEDIKTFIRTSHKFYGKNVPELKTLAKRLHEEQSLKEFYPVFNRLWHSGYQGEKSLAIYTLQLYKDDFDLKTWNFLKTKIKEIKSPDQIESIAIEIIGNILLKYPRLDKEILKLSKSKNQWLKKLAIMSTFQLIRKKSNTKLALYLLDIYVNQPESLIQESVGKTLREISIYKPEIAKRFILKHSQMSEKAFLIATENLKELRKIRKLKKLNNSSRWFFWRNIR